jgi:hypothetical protein
MWLLLIILLALLLQSYACSKADLITRDPQPTTHKYQLILDWYTMDTAFVKRTIWWQDTLSNPKERVKIDTLADMWWLMCATDRHPMHIEHWYYTRDGKKINQSKYPLNK